MDPRGHVMALKAKLKRKRQEKMLLEESLRASQVALHMKERERSMLIAKKQYMLAEEAANEKLLHDFMVFIGPIMNNDPETAQNNDGSDGDSSDGNEDDGGEGDVSDCGESDGSDGDVNGGFACGASNNGPENAQNFGEEAVMAATKGTNSEGSNDGGTGGFNSSCNGTATSTVVVDPTNYIYME